MLVAKAVFWALCLASSIVGLLLAMNGEDMLVAVVCSFGTAASLYNVLNAVEQLENKATKPKTETKENEQ